jgi:aspartyl-tRNA(Asn)/glutamyl-tRNA(Gln) amidotransferase subunit C
MLIDQKILEKLASLARIELEKKEIPYYLESLNKLLTTLSALQKVDVSSIDNNYFLENAELIYMRDDVVTEHPDPSLFQRGAPLTMQNFYLVPKVIEAGE